MKSTCLGDLEHFWMPFFREVALKYMRQARSSHDQAPLPNTTQKTTTHKYQSCDNPKVAKRRDTTDQARETSLLEWCPWAHRHRLHFRAEPRVQSTSQIAPARTNMNKTCKNPMHASVEKGKHQSLKISRGQKASRSSRRRRWARASVRKRQKSRV